MNKHPSKEGPEWHEVGKIVPPADWPPDDGGAPCRELTTWERVYPEMLLTVGDAGALKEEARVSGTGSATSPLVIEVSTNAGILPPWGSVQSAIDLLALRGMIFCFWAVAGFPAPLLWRLRQVGAIGETPAAFRYQLTSPASPLFTGPLPHGKAKH